MADIRFTITMPGLTDMIQAMRDLRTEGIPRAQRALDAALNRTAERSYGLAHLHEGDLRLSQSHSSTYGVNTWEGQIAYSSRGAAFELQRGGDHAAYIDSLAGLSEADFERAMDTMFRDL